MPRNARLDAPGLLHHVMGTGASRRAIFYNDFDREDFLTRLKTVIANNAAHVYAWCLMRNHFHLAIRTGNVPLSHTMSRLLTGYATGFNSRHRRGGQLFQNRFKSTVVDEDRFFLPLVRFIHLNPIRAGIIKDIQSLEKYPWTGHSVLLGSFARVWQDKDGVLSRFGLKTNDACREYLAYLALPDAMKDQGRFSGGGLHRSLGSSSDGPKPMIAKQWEHDERILGDGRFVESTLKRCTPTPPIVSESEEEKHEKYLKILDFISSKSGYSVSEITGPGRRRELVKQRRLLIYLAVKQLGWSATSVGRLLNLSPASALKALKNAEAMSDEHQELIEALGKKSNK